MSDEEGRVYPWPTAPPELIDKVLARLAFQTLVHYITVNTATPNEVRAWLEEELSV